MSHFHIVYGMHQRGVYELRNLEEQEKRIADGEYFALSMHELQENVKNNMQESARKYKQRKDMKRREFNI